MDRIVLYPSPVLRKQTKLCRLPSSEIQNLSDRLIRLMKKEQHGIGIAAPQIGVSERVAIVDVTARVPGAKKMILINPEILEKKDPEIGREGCMSVPDYTALVRRFRWIRYRYVDEYGELHEKISTGIEAVCVQHEIDHLDGKLLFDSVTCLKTDLLPRKISRS